MHIILKPMDEILNGYATYLIEIKLLLFRDKYIYLQSLIKRVISSVGSEHLVYTQGVAGSNPASPTNENGGSSDFQS